MIECNPKKILMVKPSALGDIVHSLPVLNVLNKTFPEAQIDWIVARGMHGVLEGHPLINKLWIIDKNKWKKLSKATETTKELVELRKSLKQEKYDLAIDLQGLLRSGLLALASGAPIRVGFSEAREGSSFCYTHKVTGGRQIHAVDRYLKVAAELGCDTANVEFPFPPGQLSDEVKGLLPEKYIVMTPGAGKAANRWPVERFGELASRLPYPVMVVGSPADAELTEAVVAHSKGNAISLGGKTDILGLVEVIKDAQFFISNDTGPMHIAAAHHVPVFAIFGPANPVRTGPYGDIHTIIRIEMDCSPCYAKKKCSHWSCLQDLDVDQVFAKIEAKLQEGLA